jgi:hypothetical protein
MIKPPRLKTGDRVAAVSLSWGGPGAFPYRYQIGLSGIETQTQIFTAEATEDRGVEEST